MSAKDSITFRYESTSPLMGHSTAWSVHYQGRPFYVVLHQHRGENFIRIDTLDTQRAIQPTSKRGQAITEMMLTAHGDMFPTEEPEDSEEPTSAVHIEHSRNDQGVSTQCGELIPWRAKTGEARAVTGRKAWEGRYPCPDCISIRQLHNELQETDLSPLLPAPLLTEVDRILSSEK